MSFIKIEFLGKKFVIGKFDIEIFAGNLIFLLEFEVFVFELMSFFAGLKKGLLI